MAASTTVRLRTTTHEALSTVMRQRGWSADRVIAEGLDVLAREERRRRFEADAHALAADPEDRAEGAAAIADVTGA